MAASRRAIGAALAALWAWGCVGGQSPADHFYRLAVPAPTASAGGPALPGTLEVDRPTGDHLMNQRSILRSEAIDDARVVPLSFHLWVDAPTVMVQRALADYLREARVASAVVTPQVGTARDWRVAGRLEHLDYVVPESRVLVALELWLQRESDGRVLVHERYRVERPTAGEGVEGAVAALGQALGSVFERFASDVGAARR